MVHFFAPPCSLWAKWHDYLFTITKLSLWKHVPVHVYMSIKHFHNVGKYFWKRNVFSVRQQYDSDSAERILIGRLLQICDVAAKSLCQQQLKVWLLLLLPDDHCQRSGDWRCTDLGEQQHEWVEKYWFHWKSKVKSTELYSTLL